MTWPRCKLLGKWLTTLKSNLLSITLNILSIGLYAFEDLSFSAMIINIHSQWMLIKLMLFFLKNKFPTPKRGTLSTFHFQSLQKKKKKQDCLLLRKKKKRKKTETPKPTHLFLYNSSDWPLEASGNTFRLSGLYVWQHIFHKLYLHLYQMYKDEKQPSEGILFPPSWI